MKCLTFALFLLACSQFGSHAFAGDTTEHAARAKAIAPFIDEDTVAVARFDARRGNVDGLVDTVKIWCTWPSSKYIHSVTVLSDFSKKQNAFLKAGGKDFYFVIRPVRGEDLLLMVIPLSPTADEKAVRGVFHSDLRFERLNNALVLNNARSGRTLVSVVSDPRPELEAAFQAAGDTTVQLIYTPPKHYRRVIEEIMPHLPREIGGGDSRIITQGCLWAAIGYDQPPQTLVSVVVKSQDAAAAAAFRAKWSEMLALAARQPLVTKYAPKFADFVDTLTPTVEGDRLVLTLDEKKGEIGTVANTFQALLDEVLDTARRNKSMDNLKQIGLAMHNYYDAHKRLPPPAIYSPDGKPLLSWRVILLPYLEQNALYKEFHLDEPWDSPHNLKLAQTLPVDYLSPKSKIKEPGRTNYVLPIGPGTMFEGREGKTFKEITDGTSRTIMAVEVDDEHAVIWSKPDDLPYDPNEPAKALGGHFKDDFLALVGDGSVHAFQRSFSADDLRAWFSAAAGDKASNP
jgi:hypothetical protein